MECKFLSHGVALSYDQVLKPCCNWQYDSDWATNNNIKHTDIVQWHDNKTITEAKALLKDGIWPTNCSECKKVELSGRQDSIRLSGNKSYHDYEDSDLTLEIRPGNVCNFACQTCWPAASTRVAQYYDKAGLINIKEVDSRSIKDFDFLSTVAHRIKNVILLGGEPFYDKNCKSFLKWAHEHLDASITMFTNGSVIDVEWIKNYKGKLTLVFSLDGIGRPAEYVRYGTIWNEVYENYRIARSIGIEVRVNITSSPFNYHLIPELIELLLEDWPDCVTFGVARGDSTYSEQVVPLDMRPHIISSLYKSIHQLQKSSIGQDQKQNAIHSLHSVLKNLKGMEYDPTLHEQWREKTRRLDQAKGIDAKNYCPHIASMLE